MKRPLRSELLPLRFVILWLGVIIVLGMTGLFIVELMQSSAGKKMRAKYEQIEVGCSVDDVDDTIDLRRSRGFTVPDEEELIQAAGKNNDGFDPDDRTTPYYFSQYYQIDDYYVRVYFDVYTNRVVGKELFRTYQQRPPWYHRLTRNPARW